MSSKSVLDLARKIVEIAGNYESEQDPITFLTYEQAYQTDFEDMMRRVPDINRIQQLLDWKPALTLDQTINDIVANFLEQKAVAVS